MTLKSDGTKVRQFACHSKHWTDAHAQDWEDPIGYPPAHKVPFGPDQVRQVIEGVGLENWNVSEL